MSFVESLAEYPEVDGLTDLILADDENTAEDMVREVGRRLRAANQVGAAKRAKATPKTAQEAEPHPDDVLAAVAARRASVAPFAQRGGPEYGPSDVLSALWRKQAPQREAEAEAARNQEPQTEWGQYLARKAAEAAEQ